MNDRDGRRALKSDTNVRAVVGLAACLLVATLSCGKNEREATQIPDRDGKRSYADFKQAVGSFPYTAPEERQSRIRKGYAQLAVGATKEQVASALGEPDYSQNNFSKDGKPKWLGSSWLYYLSKRSDGANSFDPVVHVFFGTDGRATWIVPSNIDGLNEMGSPSTRRP